MRRGFLNHKVRAGMEIALRGMGGRWEILFIPRHLRTSKIFLLCTSKARNDISCCCYCLNSKPVSRQRLLRLHLPAQAEKLPSNIKRHRNSIAFNSNNPQIAFLLGKVCEWCRVGNWPRHVLPTLFLYHQLCEVTTLIERSAWRY